MTLRVALIAATVLCAATSHASEPSSVYWHPEWPRFRPLEYVATSVLIAGTLTVVLAVPQPAPSVHGGFLFDDGVRNALVAESRSGRERAATASDVLLVTTLAVPVLGDALFSAWATHGARDVAVQMLLMDAEAMAMSVAVTTVTKRLVARERPITPECEKNPEYSPACRSTLDGSFYSGHSNAAFTAAGLVCAHHAQLPLWGGGVGDVAACVGALGFAATTGTLRVVADRHYATDVIVGTGVGLSAGLLVPWLFHYRAGAQQRVAIVPAISGGYGLSVTGLW